MKFKLRRAITGLVATAIVGGGALAAAGSAFAAAPPYEPDANSLGGLVLYNATGAVITSGTSLSHLFDFAVGTTAATTGANQTSLFFAAPNSAAPTATAGWCKAVDTAGSTFPVASPASVASAETSTGGPVDTASAASSPPGADLSLWYGSCALDTTSGYNGVVQVRVYDSGPGGVTSGTKYWAVDIVANNGTGSITTDGVTVAAGSWAVANQATTTGIQLTPSASPQPHATPIGLSSTVGGLTTGQSGVVQFYDGTTSLGTPIAVTAAAPTATKTDNPADGPHSYSATFFPTQSQVASSSSAPAAMTINAPQTPTNTTLGASPANPVAYGANVTLTADESPVTPGSVQYFDSGNPIGTVSTTDGTAGEYQLIIHTLGAGSHTITATFSPTSNTFSPSTSAPVTVTISQPTCPGDPTGAACTDTQNIQVTEPAGSLTISTPYNGTSVFTLPALQLSPDGTYLFSSATFPGPNAQSAQQFITVTSTVAGDPGWTVSVKASNLTFGTNTIPASGIGLTNGSMDNGATCSAGPAPAFQTCSNSTTFPGSVTFTDDPAKNPNGSTPSNVGLATAQTWAHTPAGNGTALMLGTLTVLAPTATPAGTYTGTLTFTVA